MAADMFTKGFTNLDMWRSVSWLVSVVSPEDVNKFCRSNGAPLPPPQGGVKAGKAGVWCVQPDGSGTWTRTYRGAKRFSTVYSSGPLRQECRQRLKHDAGTNELLENLQRFDTAKYVNEPLPPPVPRYPDRLSLRRVHKGA